MKTLKFTCVLFRRVPHTFELGLHVKPLVDEEHFNNVIFVVSCGIQAANGIITHQRDVVHDALTVIGPRITPGTSPDLMPVSCGGS